MHGSQGFVHHLLAVAGTRWRGLLASWVPGSRQQGREPGADVTFTDPPLWCLSSCLKDSTPSRLFISKAPQSFNVQNLSLWGTFRILTWKRGMPRPHSEFKASQYKCYRKTLSLLIQKKVTIQWGRVYKWPIGILETTSHTSCRARGRSSKVLEKSWFKWHLAESLQDLSLLAPNAMVSKNRHGNPRRGTK